MVTGHAVQVMPADDYDVAQTAALHVAELPHGLFPRLGEGFVRRWHRAHLRSEHGVMLVVCRGERILGFALGATDRPSNVAWIIKHHRAELLVAGLAALAIRPAVAAQFIRTRGARYGRRLFLGGPSPRIAPSGGEQEAAFTPIAVLEAVVVAADARGQGIGSALVEHFLTIAGAAGAARVELVTKEGASGAAGFYERGGWQAVGSHVDRDGDRVLTFRSAPRFAPVR